MEVGLKKGGMELDHGDHLGILQLIWVGSQSRRS